MYFGYNYEVLRFSERGTYNYHCFVTKNLHLSLRLSYNNAHKIESPNYSNKMVQVQGAKFRLGSCCSVHCLANFGSMFYISLNSGVQIFLGYW